MTCFVWRQFPTVLDTVKVSWMGSYKYTTKMYLLKTLFKPIIKVELKKQDGA